MPNVVAGTRHVLVSEWMSGTPLARIIADGTQEQRNRAGILLTRFLPPVPPGPGSAR